MSDKVIDSIIDSVPFDYDLKQDPYTYGIDSIFSMLTPVNDIVPAWWTPNRDAFMRTFWKKSDLMSSALYNMVAKMSAIPFKVRPYDKSVRSHVRDAERAEERLRHNSELGQGFEISYEKFLLDQLTQDNGGFWMVMGDGRADGPIIGPAIGLMHLDAAQCMRTRNPEFPVVYTDWDKKRYALHYTRVMAASQMTSPIREMNGVGFSAVSRAVNTIQYLIDISNVESQMMGSRPIEGFLIGKGITGQQMKIAIKEALTTGDTYSLARMARLIGIGSVNTEIDMKLLMLNTLPETFDKQTSVSLAMFSIALALGVDARELWPASASGATKADALVQHLKARGRGPGKIILMTERLINYKFLPQHLYIEFDYIDDEQDRARAEISEMQSKRRMLDLKNRVINIRVAREQMVENSELDDDKFTRMELEDGRLPDGSDVLLLFGASDNAIRAMLNVGIKNPLSVTENMAQSAAIVEKIQKRIEMLNGVIYEATSHDKKIDAMMAVAALTKLRDMYLGKLDPITGEPIDPLVMEASQSVSQSQSTDPPPDRATDTEQLTETARVAENGEISTV